MPRILGVDYGSKRIGIAISDPEARIASPERVIAGRGSFAADAEAVLAVARELEAAEIVVGLPLHMDGTESDQTRLTRAFIGVLRSRACGPVYEWDERLTSAAADALLAERRLTRKKRKARHDALAAQIILGAFLDARSRLTGN